jgi:hypothetical protein
MVHELDGGVPKAGDAAWTVADVARSGGVQRAEPARALSGGFEEVADGHHPSISTDVSEDAWEGADEVCQEEVPVAGQDVVGDLKVVGTAGVVGIDHDEGIPSEGVMVAEAVEDGRWEEVARSCYP